MNTPAHFEQGWQLVEDDPIRGLRRYRLDMGDHIIQKTEHYVTEELLDHNAEARAAVSGQKWGDGQLVARIPLNYAWEQIMPAIIEGDDKYVNRWLNNGDHAKFRIKEGKV